MGPKEAALDHAQQVVFNSSPETLPARFNVWSPLNLNHEKPLVPRHSPAEDLIGRLKCKAATLLNDSLVAVTGNCSAILLIPISGIGNSLPMKIDLSGSIATGDTAVSADGTRLAVILAKLEQKSHNVASMDVAVYSLPEKKTIFRINVAPVPRRKIAIALSRQGDLLAIQSDYRLAIWEVHK